ncbi:MAG: diguanylate cyclase [Candidatus Thiodiazotropha endolucinida]
MVSSELKSSNRHENGIRIQLRDVLRFFLPGTIMLVAVITGFYYLDYSIDRELIAEREKHNAEIGSRDIDQSIQGIAKDVAILANSVILQEFIENGSTSSLQKLGREFLNFSRSKQSFDQVRYLDENGQERVRVNYNSGAPTLVKPDRLQNKAGRYYFSDTFELSRGTLFVSPLDLNVERGEIERPFKPMIRIGTPVFDAQGNKRGIVLVNYFGQELLGSLQSSARGTVGEIMMLNRDGYWLLAPDPEDEWGFMFKNERRFSNAYPDVWESIKTMGQGQRFVDAGIFTWRTVYPLRAGIISADGSVDVTGESHASLSGREYFWKVVKLVPQSHLAKELEKRFKYGFILLLALSILLMVGSAVLAVALQRERTAVDSLRRNERRLRTITSELAEGLVVLDEKGTVTLMNPEAEHLLHWSEALALGRRFVDLVWGGERGKAQGGSPISAVLEHEQVQRVEEDTFNRSDGSQLPVAYTAAPMEYEDSVNGVIVTFEDITERKQLRDELKRMASHDPLTGLCNRRETERFLEQIMHHNKRYRRAIAICMIDIDHFKLVNDTHGHQIGDLVLKTLGKLLQDQTRDVDCAGRYGGEEFILILPETPLQEAYTLAERVRKAASNLKINAPGLEVPLSFTVSIGVSAQTESRLTSEGLINEADRTLYEAKAQGRNQVRVAQNISDSSVGA